MIVNASQAVQIMRTSADGQFLSGLAAETFGKGDGGNVEITTPHLLVKDGAVVSVSTFAQGKGGNLIINASQGEVVLTASAPKVTPQGEWLSPPECNPYKSQKSKARP